MQKSATRVASVEASNSDAHESVQVSRLPRSDRNPLVDTYADSRAMKVGSSRKAGAKYPSLSS